MIKNSACIATGKLFSFWVLMFFNDVLSLYCRNIELPKFCRKDFLHRLYDRLYPKIMRQKIPKINMLGHFSSRWPWKKFPHNFFSGNDKTLNWKIKSKKVYNRRKITLWKASSSSLLDFRVHPHLSFSMWFCQFWKLQTSIFQNY